MFRPLLILLTASALVLCAFAAGVRTVSLDRGGDPLFYRSTTRGDSDIHTADLLHHTRLNWTRSRGWDGDAVRSPDGARIAFTSVRDGNMELYVAPAVGGAPRRLTRHLSRDAYPVWSPDGTRLAFASDRHGDWNVYVMHLDAAWAADPAVLPPVTQLTFGVFEDTTPVWSPDGERLAYVTYYRNNWNIFLMNADGSGAREALVYVNARSIDPAWAADGRSIVFASDREGKQFDIYRASLETGDVTRLTDSPAMDTRPVFSPDGAAIWFESWRSGAPEIFAMEPDGANVRRLTYDTLDEQGTRVGDPG
jgi:Tol biopolymer transport system component